MFSDYKFLILVILGVIIIFILLRELSALKKIVYEGIQNSINISNNNVKLIQGIIAQENEACIDKINMMNSNLVAQVRRMNELGSQPVIKQLNHYSDSGSLNTKRNPLANNLSEFGGTNMYYMSDRQDDQTKESEKKERTSYFEIKYDKIEQEPPKNDKVSIENEKLIDINVDEIGPDSEQSDGASVIASKSVSNTKSNTKKGSITSQASSVSAGTIDFSHKSNNINSDDEESLKSLRHYKLSDLKELAEKYGLCTYFYNGNGKKVYYKKGELYDVIKYRQKD